MKMHILSGGRLRMRRAVYYPGAAREETVELPVSCTLLKHPQGNVLFDTGCSPQAAIEPEARWGGMAKVMQPIFTPDLAVVGQLEKAGLAPDDIDVVICSHLHSDHCGCNEHFKRATIMCHAAELAAARAENGVAIGYLPVDWGDPEAFETFEGEKDLFGDGRIVLAPLPGHTPGMTVARVALDRDGEFVLASDAVAVEANLRQEYAPKNSWDLARAVDAVIEVGRMEKAGATVIYGHDDAQWQTLRTGAVFYE